MACLLRVLAVVPFFGGVSSATHSKTETRLDYLAQTIESLKALHFDVWVYQAKRDTVVVPQRSIRLDVDPTWLPVAACRHLQAEFKSLADIYASHIYVTEADQVLHLADEGVFDFCTDESYVAPWRLDLVGPNGECESPEGGKYGIDGTLYGIANGAGHLVAAPEDPQGAIPVRSAQGSFSGAFLCTVEYFKRIKFRKMHNLPVEHATGFDAKSTGECFKTSQVERFYVDHLSPRDRWQGVSNA